MKTGLAKLEVILKNTRKGYVESFLPGITDWRSYLSVFNKNNIKPPGPFFQLYEWRNGLSFSSEKKFAEMWLMPLAMFLPLEDAFEFNEEVNKNAIYWSNNHLPIFSSMAGDLLLLDCDDQSENYGSIFNYSFHD
ncbi:MAG: SMI1/KNR4 family protein [Bacteroidota bacterium]